MDIVYIRSEDWEGIYIDGDLEAEDNNLSAEAVLDLLVSHPGPVDSVEIHWCDQEWMDESRTFPSDLRDVKLEGAPDWSDPGEF